MSICCGRELNTQSYASSCTFAAHSCPKMLRAKRSNAEIKQVLKRKNMHEIKTKYQPKWYTDTREQENLLWPVLLLENYLRLLRSYMVFMLQVCSAGCIEPPSALLILLINFCFLFLTKNFLFHIVSTLKRLQKDTLEHYRIGEVSMSSKTELELPTDNNMCPCRTQGTRERRRKEYLERPLPW